MGKPATPPAEPTEEILPYLQEHGISWEDFTRRMTRDKRVVGIRKQVVTDLYRAGFLQGEITRITSFSAPMINKYCDPEVRKAIAKKNRSENGTRTGKRMAGRKKPWLSKKLKRDWAEGKFDFHKGRVRSEEEREKLRESFTPERRAALSAQRTRCWEDPGFRENLERFHRSPEERARKSAAQIERMKSDPEKWTRGRGSWITAEKRQKPGEFWVRSTFEAAAVRVIEDDPEAESFVYEKRFKDCEGKTAIPDLTVFWRGGSATIVEVKASWVLKLPDDHERKNQLRRYAAIAERLGYDFEVWTEEDKLCDYLE